MIDIGANLAHDSFDADRESVLQRAWDAGVTGIVVTGSDAASARRALALARQQPGRLWSTAGLHPHHAADWSDEHAALFRELGTDPACVSLGECGLDYFRMLAPRDRQIAAFESQLAIAAQLGKPLFLHQRDAHADFLAVLKTYRSSLREVVVHCFTDTPAAMEDYLALGCHIGITGWVCDERRGKGLYESVKLIPDARLLVETDAPYLLPRTIRPAPASRRNEPMYLPAVVATIAAARGQPVEHVARITTDNARSFFRLSSRA